MPSSRATARRRHTVVAGIAALSITAFLMWGYLLIKPVSSTPSSHDSTTQVVPATASARLPVNYYAMQLPAGDVAVSIPFADVPDYGGYAEPGDHINIICDTGNNSATYCFTNVLVLQVGSKSQQPTPSLGASARPDGGPGQAPVISGAVLILIDMSASDALAVKEDLVRQTGQAGDILGYALVSAHDPTR